ncbi:hypothetical protein VNO80_01311 [Phaseolus coccineus]|uniref:Apple domain-containing protein n=1 Tax=Phaseolus coccineus TaxID=3886 RepID=A0AAN9RSN1_PHACN
MIRKKEVADCQIQFRNFSNWDLCQRNCPCTAYPNIEIIRKGRSGCVVWVGELLDVRRYSSRGQDLYVRLVASDVGMFFLNYDSALSLSVAYSCGKNRAYAFGCLNLLKVVIF